MMRRCRFGLLGLVLAGFCRAEEPAAVVALGERLFADFRFAQRFAAEGPAVVNRRPVAGDPILATLPVAGLGAASVRGPLAGDTVSCRACHLSDEAKDLAGLPGGGLSLFADFADRSPLPGRPDHPAPPGRHTPTLVDVAAAESGEGLGLLHWDGEFASLESLVAETFVGRNFGWRPAERGPAVRHFARVLREDDGSLFAPAVSYGDVFAGRVEVEPSAGLLPPDWRVALEELSDDEVLAVAAKVVSTYLRSLRFARDERGEFVGSAYDQFLLRNRLPRSPAKGESAARYARRVHEMAAQLNAPQWIAGESDGQGRFGPLELQGLRIFFRGAIGYVGSTQAGNCVDCHVPPTFSDGRFHNTGVAQDEYDAVHGAGRFAALPIPNLAERSAGRDRWLPESATNPGGAGLLRSGPTTEDARRADLGLWNVTGNPDLPTPQPAIERFLNAAGNATPDEVLRRSIGRFKTPGLRGLGYSSPYFHGGQVRTLEEVVEFYRRMSDLAREGGMRNAPLEYDAMRLAAEDVAPLVAFLRSLNEAYPPRGVPAP